MQIYRKPEAVIFGYPLRSLGAPEDFLFFDIETTGFSPSNAQVYLIGALSHTEEEGWVLRQWFAERLSDEEELLRSFFSFAASFKTLIHYNGDSFDLPFLAQCAAQYGIEAPFAGLSSLDLYRAVRPFRKLLGTERLNQKSMERFLGLERLDRYTGGELISVYEAYTVTGEAALRHNLLLHNEEDLTGLPVLLSLLSYHDMFCGSLASPETELYENMLLLRAHSSAELPEKVSLEKDDVYLKAEGHTLSVYLPLSAETMTCWFANYKDYYYLPLEHCCVHKSVGEFVDKSSREKATARNACTSKEDIFVPLFGPSARTEHVFRREYRGKEAFLPVNELINADDARKLSYLTAVLEKLGLREKE